MFTMVASRATISWATAMTTRASQRVSRSAATPGPRPATVGVLVMTSSFG